MTKQLKVIKPFFVMEQGDTFELSENGMYVSSYSSEYNKADENNSDVSATYNSVYQISQSFAEELVSDGYLEPVVEDKQSTYVNVFDEINSMLSVYTEDLNNLDEDCKELPACMKVEKETVLRNMIKVLNHLNSLKK